MAPLKNKKLIGQKCECFFTGAAMLCSLHAAAPKLLAKLKAIRYALHESELEGPDGLDALIASAESR